MQTYSLDALCTHLHRTTPELLAWCDVAKDLPAALRCIAVESEHRRVVRDLFRDELEACHERGRGQLASGGPCEMVVLTLLGPDALVRLAEQGIAAKNARQVSEAAPEAKTRERTRVSASCGT